MDNELLAAFARLMDAEAEYRFAVRRQKQVEAMCELDEAWESDWLAVEEECAA